MESKKKPETDKDLIQVAARIARDKYVQLKITAAKENKFINDLLNEAIDYILKKYSAKGK